MYSSLQPLQEVQVFDFTTLKREIILHILVNNTNLVPLTPRLECTIFNKVSKISKNCIITGSQVLYLYGLIDRTPADFDLITNKETITQMLETNNLKVMNSKYDQELDFTDIISTSYNYNDTSATKIDFFIKEDYTDYTTFNDIRLDDISNIFEEKEKMGREKDYLDLKYILNKLHGNIK